MLDCKACFFEAAPVGHLDLADGRGSCLRAASGVPVRLQAVTGRGQ